MISLMDFMSVINGDRADYVKRLAFSLLKSLGRKPTPGELRKAIDDAVENDFPALEDYPKQELEVTTPSRKKGSYD